MFIRNICPIDFVGMSDQIVAITYYAMNSVVLFDIRYSIKRSILSCLSQWE